MTHGKLVAIDIDGTLVGESLDIAPVDREAIARTIAAGFTVCLASGRLFEASRPFAQQLSLRGPIIVLQGAAVYDLSSGALKFCSPLARDVALRAYDWLVAEAFHLQLYFGDRLYLDEINDWARYYLRLSPVEPVVVADLRALLTDVPPPSPGPLKVLAVGDAEKVLAGIAALSSELGPAANVFRSLPVYLEVTDPAANKGHALRTIAREQGIDLRESAAIGDSDNDVSMFEVVGRAFAVGNATPAAKAAASEIVASRDRGGVADALGRLQASAANLAP